MSAVGAAQIREPAYAGPAALQLAAGMLGTLFAFVFVCPAVGVASLGALSDGRRYAGNPAALPWRAAYGTAVVLALVATAFPFFVPHVVLAWPMLVFALLGLLVVAASVLAAIPGRLSALHPSRLHASGTGYLMLGTWGVTALVKPAGWVCVAAAASMALVLAADHLLGRRAGP